MLHHHDPQVASTLIAGVLPTLAQVIAGAGDSLAIEIADGEKVNIRHRTQAQQLLMFALADYLTNSACDHTEDHIYEPLRPYELSDLDFAHQWFADLVDDEDEPVYTVADLNAAIDADEAEQTVTPVTPAQPADAPRQPKFLHRMENREIVSDDADALVQYAILPFITEKLDELSDRMAREFASIEIIDRETAQVAYDIAEGRRNARRALWESVLAWMQNDPACDGQWIGVLL